MFRRMIATAAAALLSSCQTLPVVSAAPAVALTFDDLPVHGEPPAGETSLDTVAKIVATLKGQGVTAHGFVNGHWTADRPASAAALTGWRRAGLPLANHGWSHLSLDAMTTAQFEDELLRNEPLLKTSGNRQWNWFRFPFLHEGKDPAMRAAARAVLARHGYRIAAVTMDFGDWQWTAPYARCTAKGDTAAIAELEQRYLAAARQSATQSRRLAAGLYGHDVPLVLLLHAGGMTAHMLPKLLDLYREQHFRFVTLDEAERDPLYAADVDPALPAGATSLEQRAAAAHVAVPQRTDHAPALEKLCAPSP